MFVRKTKALYYFPTSTQSKHFSVEFPVVVFDAQLGQIVDSFASFVKPTENSTLSTFCTNLTGIQQNQVDLACPLSSVLRDFEHWLKKKKEDLGCVFKSNRGANAIFVTWTDWDISTCLWDECRRKKLALPADLLNRMDLKAIFQQWLGSHNARQKWRGGLTDALNLIGLNFEGRPHCGLDDAKNTARLLAHLISKNVFTTPLKSS